MAKPDHVDLPAEAVKTVRCLVSYLQLRRSMATFAHRDGPDPAALQGYL